MDKEPLDNSGYLTRPYLEPLAKMKFRYNCERVVGLDKHEGFEDECPGKPFDIDGLNYDYPVSRKF